MGIRIVKIAVSTIALTLTVSGCQMFQERGTKTTVDVDRTPRTVVDDAAITTRVKTALLKASDVSGTSIQVQTYNGVVQLSGFVDTSQQMQRAAEIVRSIEGVKSVRNDIQVKAK